MLIEKSYAAIKGLKDILPANPPTTLNDFFDIFARITNVALDVVGMLAVIMILYGAVVYVTAYGDDAKAETAKKTIYWSLLGLVVVALAYTFLNIGKGLLKL